MSKTKVDVAVENIIAFANGQKRTANFVVLPLVEYGPLLDADFNEVGRRVGEAGFTVEFKGRQPGFPGTGRMKVSWTSDNQNTSPELPETPQT